MKIAIMQPYFFPYIGYFQLINTVDEFVIYDNIKFTKKGWINRNRILVNGTDAVISLPLKKDSDYLHVKDRYLAESWEIDKKKILNKITEAYRKAPFFKEIFELIEKCLMHDDTNLFKFILNSIYEIMNYLDMKTKITLSSTININHQLKSEEKVIAICNYMGANIYINPIGGVNLYNQDRFKSQNLILRFQKAHIFSYIQFNNNFIPSLSIIDVMMFNSKDEVITNLNKNHIL
jgi:hypothetical protein